MERELNVMLPKSELKGTSVVFRQGSRLMVGDLCKVSVHTARSVVVFSNGTKDADKADAEVLQVRAGFPKPRHLRLHVQDVNHFCFTITGGFEPE
jgi:hypothetical protein